MLHIMATNIKTFLIISFFIHDHCNGTLLFQNGPLILKKTKFLWWQHRDSEHCFYFLSRRLSTLAFRAFTWKNLRQSSPILACILGLMTGTSLLIFVALWNPIWPPWPTSSIRIPRVNPITPSPIIANFGVNVGTHDLHKPIDFCRAVKSNMADFFYSHSAR